MSEDGRVGAPNIELAGKRAGLAMTTLAIQMHRATCHICKHGGPPCEDARRAILGRDRLRSEIRDSS